MRKRTAGAQDLRNLYQQGDVWYLKIQIDGRELRESLRTTVLAEAQRLRDQRIAALKGELHSWPDAVVMWHGQFLPHNVKPATAARYLCSIDQIRQAVVTGPNGSKITLENLFIEHITTKTISEVVTWSKRTRPGVTHATLRRDLTALASVIHMTVGLGWRQDNPAKTWDRSHVKERREPVTLPTVAEIDRMACCAMPPMMAAAIRLAQFTGMRQEELFGLRWSQLTRDMSSVTLTKTKNGRARVVPLDSRAVSILVSIPRHLKCPYVLWRHTAGEGGRQEAVRFENPSSVFARSRRRTNLREEGKQDAVAFRFHDLRHWFAVDYLQRRQGSIYDLQGVMGHSSVKVTELYLDYVDPETQQHAIRHVGSVAGRSA